MHLHMQLHITCTISVQVTISNIQICNYNYRYRAGHGRIPLSHHTTAAYLSHTTPNTTKDDPYPIPTTALNPHSHPTHPHAENARTKKRKRKSAEKKTDRETKKGEERVGWRGGGRERPPPVL